MLCHTVVKMLALAVLVVVMLSGDSVESNQKFCGKTLTQAMDRICLNGFKSMIKKSYDETAEEAYNEIGDGAEGEEDDMSQFPLGWYPNSPFLAKVFGAATENFMAKTRRRRHGIYDECCLKSCTYTELYSYCLEAKQ